MSQEHREPIVIAANDIGIAGVMAILSEWATDEGGLAFVKRCVASMNESDVHQQQEDWSYLQY